MRDIVLEAQVAVSCTVARKVAGKGAQAFAEMRRVERLFEALDEGAPALGTGEERQAAYIVEACCRGRTEMLEHGCKIVQERLEVMRERLDRAPQSRVCHQV